MSCLLFALAFIAWPLRGGFSTTLLGSAAFHYDAYLNAGVLEWGYRSLWHSGLSFFDWTAGFPLKNSLAGTENLVGWQLFYTPLRAIGVGVVASYSVVVFLSLLISGVGASVLCRRFGGDLWAATFAGLAFAFNPFHLNLAVHLQSLAICWVPFALLFLDRYLESADVRDAVAFAAFVAITLLSGLYLGVMLCIVVLLFVALSAMTGRTHLNAKILLGVIAALASSAVLVSPVLWHYVEFGAEHGLYRHAAGTLVRFSIHAGGFLRAPMWESALAATPLGSKVFEALTSAFPGVVVSLLVVILLIRKSPQRSVANVLMWLIAICVLLAMGPYFKIRTEGIVESMRWLPMPGKLWMVVPGIRWPMRVYLFATLFLSLLAGLGLMRLRGLVRQPLRRAVGLVVLALLIVELHPGASYATQAARASEPLAMSDAYPFLASESDSGGVAEIPERDSTGYATPLLTRYVFGSSGHLRRVVAYHGNIIPAVIDTLRSAIERFPSPDAISLLKDHGVMRIVVHRDLARRVAADSLIDAAKVAGLRVIFDRGHSVVFALPPGTKKERTP
jgi:hypothetical protein